MSIYNNERYIKEAIESILHQTYQLFEIIITNDGSTDNSLGIIESFNDNRIRILKNEKNIGLAASLNNGLVQCKGKYIARFDADDKMNSKRLERQLDFLQNNPTIDIVGSHLLWIDGNGDVLRKWNHWPIGIDQNIFFIITGNNPVGHPAVLIRKNILDNLGGYNTTFKTSQDIDLWFRLYLAGGLTDNIDEYLTFYRIHSKQTSALLKDQQIDDHRLAFISFYKSLINVELDSASIIQYLNILSSKERLDQDNMDSILRFFFTLLNTLMSVHNLSKKSRRRIYRLFLDNMQNNVDNINIIGLIKHSINYDVFHIDMLKPLWNIL